MTDTTNIQGRAILVSLNISKWLARKFDGVATREVNENHGAQDAGKFSKKLMGKKVAGTDEPNAYGALMAILTTARTDHYANTLAWGNQGWRLLPVGNYDEYMQRQRAHLRAFSAALPVLVRDYPALRAAAPAALGTLFNEKDYPAADAISRRFSIGYEREPLPVSGELIVDELAAPQVAVVRAEYAAKVDERIETATRAAMDDARKRVGEVVREIAATMNKKKGEKGFSFKDSKVGNVKRIVSTMRRMNVTDDDEFTGMLDRIEKALADVDPQTLRDDKTARAAVAKTADEIVADMGAIFGGAK
jgi:hypothetical protein|tara:strand:- start:470 stop:1384 length:915 start_codon:yes stop_codon:yes gene_type:complete